MLLEGLKKWFNKRRNLQMARVENNPKEIAKVMNELLCGRYFEGYEFSTSFVLKTFSNR